MFVWVFHRISGLLLILLIGFKMYTGFGTAGSLGEDVVPYWTTLHSNLGAGRSRATRVTEDTVCAQQCWALYSPCLGQPGSS